MILDSIKLLLKDNEIEQRDINIKSFILDEQIIIEYKDNAGGIPDI